MKILIITLNNIGDVVLTLPAIDILRRDFPDAGFTVVTGPRAIDLFKGDPKLQLVVFDKHSSVREKIVLTFYLRKEKFDLLIDFRNTAFPLLLRSRKKTSAFVKAPQNILHKKAQHLLRLKTIYDFSQAASPNSIFIRPEDRDYIDLVLGKLAPGQRLVVVSPGAANEWKRWTKKGFAEIGDRLIEEFGVKLVLVGDSNDRLISREIIALMRNKPLDLSGKTSLKQLAALLQKANLVVSCDSAIMHMASYFDIPVVAIFGPTDPAKYGPWSKKSFVVRREIGCAPCEKSGCEQSHECMELIGPEEVLKAIRENFSDLKSPGEILPLKAFAGKKRILIVRTDRIGDVLLTTPAIKAVRENYPGGFLAVMVAPIARDIVEGNPYIDEVIIYDKKKKDKGLFGFIKMVAALRKLRFDTALVLHTKKRTNLLCFLSGIKERVGYYNNKFGFLLTRKIPDVRREGKKHEAQYCLDVLRAIGMEAKESELFMPLNLISEEWAEAVLLKNQVERKDKLIAINPGASCPSKRWPAERFAILADKLIEKYAARICLLSGPSDVKITEEVISQMHHPALDLSGKTSVRQLASFLKRCNLFISNDSGPVHIACAVGTPVVAIFGRNESGLSPKRWGPLSKTSAIIHKDVGCVECLAHNCKKGFKCLLAITEEEVLQAVEKLLKS